MWLTLSVLIQTGIDPGLIPDNLSLIYVIVGSAVIIFIVYSLEQQSLTVFCKTKLS